MESYVLVPYVGVTPVTFELLPRDVEAILGPPSSVEKNCLSERDENRGAVGVRYSRLDQKVVEISFLPSESLVYAGHDLFRHPDPIGFLSEFDEPLEYLGFVVFLKLGITITGFHDHDESQKAITVFRKRRWDKHRSQLKPLSMQPPTE